MAKTNHLLEIFEFIESWHSPADVTLLPAFAVPVCERDPSWRGVKALPPYSSIAGLANVGEHSVFGNGGHGVGVGLIRGAWSHTEETVLWVDSSKFTCRDRRDKGSHAGLLHYLQSACVCEPCSCLSPWLSNFIHAMSSPTHSTFQPGRAGFIMAKLVLPQALGKAAAT